jgi:hypothetical protein
VKLGQIVGAMHVCPNCSSELVQPVQWAERGQGCWWVELRCPECEWSDADTYGQNHVDAFDKELDQGMQLLLQDLHDLTRANMEDEAERFAQALAVGAVLPEDF